MTSKIKIAIAVTAVIVVVIVVAVTVPIVLTTKKSKDDIKTEETTIKPSTTTTTGSITITERTSTSTTTEKPFDPNDLKDDEASRIDCYLEAQSSFENLTKYACEKRNCIYNPIVSHSKVPKCYFDRQNLGYTLDQQNESSYWLKQSGKAPFMGVIDRIALNVEYYGSNMIRVKVINTKYYKEMTG